VTDPSITAELLNSVGYSLVGLGEYAEAVPVLEEAVRVSVSTLGADHSTTISAQLNLVEAYLATGNEAKARTVIGTALSSAQRNGDVKLRVDALRWMAAVVADYDMEVALKYANDSVQLADAKLANDKHTVMLAQWQATDILWRMRSKDSLKAARRTYDLAHEYWGGRSTPDVLAARSLYANILGAQGDPQAAVAELRAVREEQLRLFGSSSYADIARTNERIAAASLSLGDPVTAIASYREAVDGLAAQAGGGAADVIARDRMRLGAALLEARRFDEGEGELRKALAVLEPLKDSRAMETRWFLAQVAMRNGHLPEAESMLAPPLAKAPASSLDVAKFKWRLGQLRSLQGRHDEALSALREAEEGLQKSGTPSQAAVALGALGGAQLAAGDAAAALATFQRSDTLLTKLHPKGSPDHADLLIDLARAHLALGHPAEAVTAAAQAEAFWTRFDAQNRQAGLAQLWHARALLADRQGEQALQTWRRASGVLSRAALPADGTLLAQSRREFQAASQAR